MAYLLTTLVYIVIDIAGCFVLVAGMGLAVGAFIWVWEFFGKKIKGPDYRISISPPGEE